MALEKILERPGDEPVDFRIRVSVANGIEKRQAVNHIPQGTGLDDQDLSGTAISERCGQVIPFLVPFRMDDSALTGFVEKERP
jgi:hypothetical protein